VPLVELQQDCDAVERALEDEAAVAKDDEPQPSAEEKCGSRRVNTASMGQMNNVA
jgi:hypothetical protein